MQKVIIGAIVICLLISGCNYLPSPYDVVRAPLGRQAEDINEDTSLKRFIPSYMVMLTPENSGNRYKMRSVDIENDGQYELVVFYGLPGTFECKGLVILKGIEDNWVEFHLESFSKGTKYNIEETQFVDITNDGYLDMIIQLSTFNDTKMVNLYTFREETKRLYTLGANRIEIIHNETTAPALALWTELSSKIYEIEIIRWEKDGFVNATYDYPGFFLQLLPVYKGNADDDSEDKNNLLLYADVLMKSGDYTNGFEQIEKYLTVNEADNDINKMKAYFIKGRCLYSLGEMIMARDALRCALDVPDFDVETLIEAKLLLAEIYYLNNYFDLAGTEVDGCRELLYYFVNSNYKAHIWQSAYESKKEQLELPKE